MNSVDINNGFSNFCCSQALTPLMYAFSTSPSKHTVILTSDHFHDKDPFKNSDPFSASDIFPSDMFAAEDMLKDTFTSKSTGAVGTGIVSDGLAFDVDPLATTPPISHKSSPFPH